MRAMKLKKKTKQKIISVLCAVTLTLTSMPVGELSLPLNKAYHAIRAWAASSGEPVSIDSMEALASYAQNYDETHIHDIIELTFGDNSTVGEVTGFTPIAATEEIAFEGKIKVGDGMQLNLPTVMFGWVTDDVEIVKASDEGTAAVLAFTRTKATTDNPIFAQNVKHNRNSGSAEWSFQYDEFRADDTTTNRDVYDYAGFIGTLGEEASVKINKIVNNNQGLLNNKLTYANISATGNAGLVCCTMSTNSTLEIDEITCESGNFTVSGATAGGLVGSMAAGSKLILSNGLSSVQDDSKAIAATNGYAGGIVGSCSGTITFNHSGDNVYTVNQVISGTSGSGGVAGYYTTDSTSNNYAVDYSKLSLGGTCRLNGAGNCGGLFGEVLNDGEMTITDSVGLNANHGTGTAASFGGLVGKYTADNLADSLTVSTSAITTPNKSGGDANYYGGIIGVVDSGENPRSSYVKVNAVQVNSSNANASGYFGGLVGAAKTGFIELSGENKISYSNANTGRNFGGVVGNLENGVLILSGTTDLTGAASVLSGTTSTGQIVGYRNCGFIWAEDGWKLKRQTTGQLLDDVGSWGEVLNYGGGLTSIKSDLITIADHAVTIRPVTISTSDDSTSVSISSLTDFALAALNIQHNNGTGNAVIHVTNSCASSTLLGADLAVSGTINLTNTGITGLTRDSGSGNDYLTYTGKLTGSSASITLSTGAEWGESQSSGYGNGKIYRHLYNGLLAKTNNAEISGITISSDSNLKVKALWDGMHVGSLVAYSSGNLTIDGVTVSSEIDHEGSNTFRIGGFVGEVAGNVNIGNTTACTFNGTIGKNNYDSSNSVIGGIVGTISNDAGFSSSIKNTTVGGKIKSAVSATGGLIGTIADSSTASGSRTLVLNNVNISGLEITNSKNEEAGGFLGYQWLKTDVTFDDVEVSDSAILTATTATDIAGLIYRGTGYYKVNAGGIHLDSMTVNASAATSFGLIVNKGYNTDKASAIYLELGEHDGTNKAFTATSNVSISLGSSPVFDELVAYTGSSDDIMANGRGIVSINTYDGTNESSRLLQMGTSDTDNTGLTYQNQTAYGANSKLNPHTRYYYNLDEYRTTPPTDSAKLLVWSVYQYAHSSIQSYFWGENQNSISGNFDMKGYSYYPINLSGTLTISGTLKLWNPQFDQTAEDTRVSTAEAQHKLIHNALLNNLSGTLNASSLTLDGEVSKIGSNCGVLVQGTVGSDASGTPAKVNINGLTLAGVKIANESTNTDYAPLLVNSGSSNSVFQIEDVKNTSGYSSGAIIATSLLGNIGASDATNIKVNFVKIQLDGRSADHASSAGLDDLDTIYHTKRSLFRKSTLIDTFAYQSNSGSNGVYNYEYSLDWKNNGNHTGQVTYGAEIDNTVENKDSNGISKQLHYNGSGVFTHPTDSSPAGKYGKFADYFQRYVNSVYTDGGTNHELRVNISTTSFDGCGTYNDPYQITSGADLLLIAELINGTSDTTITGGIKVPNIVAGLTANSNSSTTWCHDKADHTAFITKTVGTSRELSTWAAANGSTITDAKLAEYLAGAYYVIPESVTDKIVLPDEFLGLSDSSLTDSDNKYVFRGVINGNGGTIVNNTSNPLIASSNGCVVKNLKLEIQPKAEKIMYLNMTNSKAYSFTGPESTARCQAYGGVIGQVFGGDNIIDTVSVDFTGTVVDARNSSSGSVQTYSHLVPIGGYIGVVVNGGVYFRGMTGTAASKQIGITKDNLSGFECPKTAVEDNPDTPDVDETDAGDPTSSDETAWLYVNPIIGRVINGFAITENTTAFRPFENGTRTYPSGTTETWANGAVTMHNGTKNYSIADVKNDASSTFTMMKGGVVSGAEDSVVIVSDAQQLFIISLITECGLGTSSNGKYDNDNNILKPYGDYMATHLANYTNVGKPNLTKADADYVKAATDIHATNDLTTKVPYLIKNYTPEGNTSYPYPAFDLAAFEGGKNELYLNLVFDDNGAVAYAMPDGFRGLGSLLLGETYWYTGTESGKDTKLFNAMYLHSLTGNDKAVSLNMSLLLYGDDNYPRVAYSNEDANLKNGFGFFNALRSENGSATANKIQGLSIKGKVKFDLIDSTSGSHIAYNEANLKSSSPAVGGFIGAPGVDTNKDNGGGDMWIEGINLADLYVYGVRFAGGMVGCSNAAKTYTFYDCSADDLEVYGGTSVGGLIGYIRHSSSNIVCDFNGNEFGVISVTAQSSWNGSTAGFTAAGALFGDNYSGQNGKDKGVTVKNVTIRNATSRTKGYIGYSTELNPNTMVRAGGVVGIIGRASRMTISNVTVKDIDIKGYNVGGFIGHAVAGNIPVTLDGCKVLSTQNAVIENVKSDGTSGGFVGDWLGAAGYNLELTNCEVDNYTIKGDKYCGGISGKSEKANKTILHNVIVNSVSIITNEYAGGLISNLADGQLEGYNILVNATTFARKSGSGDVAKCGYIAGKNADKPIKLVGYSRQGTISTANVIGNYTTNMYGSDGYVVFADYDGTAVTAPNNQSANIGGNLPNVEGVDTAQTITDTIINNYTVVMKNNTVDSCNPSFEATPTADTIKTSTFSGTKVWYVADNSKTKAEKVGDLTDAEGTRSAGGFKMYCVGTNKYVANYPPEGNNKGVLAEVDNNSAATWYFEIVEGTTDNYKIYTYDSGSKVYIHQPNADAPIQLVSTPTIFTVTVDNGKFRFQCSTNWYLQHSGSGGGIRLFQSSSNSNSQFTLEYVSPAIPELKAADYTSITSFNGTAVTYSGNGTAVTNTDRLAAYETAYDATFESNHDSSNVLWYINHTVTAEIAKIKDTAKPYVTVNPKFDIVKNSNDEPLQWLTSDGVAKVGYFNSTTKRIIDNINSNTAKSYQNTGLTKEDTTVNEITEMGLDSLSSILNDKMSGFTAAHKCDMTAYHGEEFPVLVIDDIGTANEIINDYLKVLTNTSFDFYETDDNVYEVGIYKMVYNTELNKFVRNTGSAALKLEPNRYFKITTAEVDNTALQFSLIDVQFKDPGNATGNNAKVAYHLYVPVVVTKMLHYDFTARYSSGTTYEPTEYPSSYRNLIENLGNPVTLKFSYIYKQEANDWAAAINSGENVQRNYTKELMFKVTSNAFPTDAELILVDPNSDRDLYYTSNLSADSNVLTEYASVTIDGVTTVEYRLKLAEFSGFSPIMLNDLMTVSLDASATEKTLVVDNSNYTVIVNDNSNDNGLKLRLATDAELADTTKEKYAVSVTLPQGYKDSKGKTYPQENYYLSFFTKADKNDSTVYHYEISSTGTFPDTEYPSARTGNESPHLFLGNLYDNTVRLVDGNANEEITKSNNYLEAQLTATVGFTQNAIDNGITSYINNNNVEVFQTFLTSLNMLYKDQHNNSVNNRGLLVKPTATVSEYTVAGTDRKAWLEDCKYSNSYVEIPNSYNIKNDLRKAAATNNHNITITANVRMTYSPDILNVQFPESDGNTRDVGTYVIGYSNISSSQGQGAASRASDNTEEKRLPDTRKLYYMRDVSPVEFRYNAVANEAFENDGNGNYGQLGINANELTGNYVQINTAGIYDISSYGLRTRANFVKIQVKLSKKSDYSEPLDIPTYLKDYELLDVNENDISESDESRNIYVDKNTTTHIYTYIVPKTELQTVSENVYRIPINFKAYTGYNTDFERKTGEGIDMQYSNYKVTVTVGLLEENTKDSNSTAMTNSADDDHVIYTNARLISDIVTPKTTSAENQEQNPEANP